MKYIENGNTKRPEMSHPSRGGWIEIIVEIVRNGAILVPPLTGWVD